MSNLTDGKNALASGDFDVAQRKLNRALDRHPDSGELWWALMLSKAHCRNDVELENKLVAEFTAAAKTDAPAPYSPLNDAYCMNALKYEKGDKHRDFVRRLDLKLDAIWTEYRGKPLKTVRMPKKATAKPRKKADVKSILTYVLSAAALAAGLAGFAVAYALGQKVLLIVSVVLIFVAIGVITVAIMKNGKKRRENEPKTERRRDKPEKKKREIKSFDDDFD